jgi:hypothetical protein
MAGPSFDCARLSSTSTSHLADLAAFCLLEIQAPAGFVACTENRCPSAQLDSILARLEKNFYSKLSIEVVIRFTTIPVGAIILSWKLLKKRPFFGLPSRESSVCLALALPQTAVRGTVYFLMRVRENQRSTASRT